MCAVNFMIALRAGMSIHGEMVTVTRRKKVFYSQVFVHEAVYQYYVSSL